MPLFTSSKEKRLWLCALIVLVAIFSTLAIGRPLQKLLSNQNTQAILFLLGMALTGMTIIIHGLKMRISKTEMVIWLGLATVYIMLILRLGATERSHLIEYSVLAIFTHKAITERLSNKNRVLIPAVLAFAITVIIGVLDECIQLFLPNRVFDPLDMLFNGLAVFMAIGGSFVLQWAQKKFRKN